MSAPDRKSVQGLANPDFLLGGRTSASAGVQTLVREGSPLVKLRNSACKVQSVDGLTEPFRNSLWQFPPPRSFFSGVE